ncbi:LOW QUALITY PROTEIN: hypothetical protein PanWU01x14_115380 [Parasponia andersonii]|uniref:Uncharacterized protein n=1 Tax=Parasponia andersonii TaxID=3476 RepID=A0A2P5CXS8_PARAD|nr:LOW QUALITY PROTEIN: hypothetical protein PanWU01x14_115380 [Parasponia andersonii]
MAGCMKLNIDAASVCFVPQLLSLHDI